MTTRSGRGVPLASCLAMVLLASSALAAPSDPGRAEELIRQANDLRRQGKDPSALPLLREAYKIARSPRTAAQLGLAELALGYWLESERHLDEALAPASHPWVDRNRKVLEDSLATARAHLGHLAVTGTPAGAEVRVDDAVVGTLPLAAPTTVSEGQVTVDVQSPGYRNETRTIKVRGGEKVALSFSLIASEPSTTVPRPGPREALPRSPSILQSAPRSEPAPQSTAGLPAWRRALPWGFAGAVALVGAFAVWQHVEWQHSVSKFDGIPACGVDRERRGSDSRCAGLYTTYSGQRTRAFVGYGAAGALGIAAVVVMVMNAQAPDERSQSLAPGPGQVGLSYRATF